MATRVNDLGEFRQLLHVAVMCAPDKFPVRDFLQPQDQLTLDSAFKDLNRGIEFVRGEAIDKSKLQAMLDQSLALYRQGRAVEGAHILQDLEDMVFGKPVYRP
jgi:hypothetical protein